MTSPTSQSLPAGDLPTTVPDVLKSIADDIERLGHFQQKPDQLLWSPRHRPDDPCCLLINPTRRRVSEEGEAGLMWLAEQEIIRRVEARTEGPFPGLAGFSDETPTEELLEMLRAE